MSGPFAFDASTPAEAQTKPWCVSAMTSGGRVRTSSLLSRRMTSSRRGSSSPGELACPLRRLEVGEMDDAALDLRHGLLGDDEDVARLELPRRRPGGRGEVVSLLELRDPPEREDANLAGHGRPVTRIPACPR